MRKIIVFNLISLDGYFAGVDGSIEWHNVDDEFNKFAVEQTSTFGAIIFGKTTYKMFEDYWPNAVNDPKMSREDKVIAKTIDDISKIVFSKKLKKVEWNNTTLFHEIDLKEIKKLKDQKGKDMVIFGSGTIVNAFAKLNLIDEYRLMVNPVVLGSGKSLFKDIPRINLKLNKTKVFKNGNVLLYYTPKK